MFFGFKKYNYAENLVGNTYLFGTFNLVTAFVNSTSGLLTETLPAVANEIPNLAYLYPLFGYFHFFGGKWYWRAFRTFFMLFFIMASISLLAITIVFALKLNSI